MSDLKKIEDCSRISVSRRIPSKLLKARLEACKAWPFSRDAILSMAGIPIKGLGTMAVDKYWRLYFDPNFVEVTEDAELAAVILHELLHLLYGHHKRGVRIIGEYPTAREKHLMNLAADAQINYLLEREIKEWRWRPGTPRQNKYANIEIGDDWVLPDSIGVTPNITMEETYRELQDKEQEKHDAYQCSLIGTEEGTDISVGDGFGEGDFRFPDGTQAIGGESIVSEGQRGSDTDDREDCESGGEDRDSSKPDYVSPQGGDDNSGDNGATASSSEAGAEPDSPCTGQLWTNSSGELEWTGPPTDKPGTGGSGSSADGLARDWELPAPTEDNGLPGIDAAHAATIINEIAKQIQGADVGSCGGSLTRWANGSRRIQKDPREVILRVVRKRVEEHTGIGERSFRRPNRRYAHSGVIMPSNVAVVPQIAVFVDTSGSMRDEDFSLALGMINKIISSFRIRDGIMIITGDTEAKTKMHTAGQVKQLELKGGGGTDVGRIVSTGVEGLNKKPHIAVAITDGYTGWPSNMEEVGVPMLAVITRPRADVECYAVPSWIETIYLKD